MSYGLSVRDWASGDKDHSVSATDGRPAHSPESLYNAFREPPFVLRRSRSGTHFQGAEVIRVFKLLTVTNFLIRKDRKVAQ